MDVLGGNEKCQTDTVLKRYPIYFPRFIQHAVWSFCAEGGVNQCNGNIVDVTGRCSDKDCPIYSACGRVCLTSHEPK
jgi:hypothetical protein